MMTTFSWLLRREFWENRGGFWRTYLILGIALAVISLMAWILGMVFIDNIDGDGFFLNKGAEALEGASREDLVQALRGSMFGVALIYCVILFFVVLFYCLGALYDDCKDRSILFWKSMPVADTTTVISKLVSATVIAPLLMIVGLALTHIALGLVTSLILVWAGANPFKFYWVLIEAPKFWFSFTASSLITSLWMLPIWSWLLLCSSIGKPRPFLLAVPIPFAGGLIVSWLEALFTGTAKIGPSIGTAVLERFGYGLAIQFGSVIPDDADINIGELGIRDFGLSGLPWSAFAQPGMWWGWLWAAIFIVAAIWMRRRRDDSI